MAAPTNPCYVKILLANSEPSTHGTFRTLRDVRLESGMRFKADVRPTPLNLWVHALNTSQEQPSGTPKGCRKWRKGWGGWRLKNSSFRDRSNEPSSNSTSLSIPPT